MACGIHVDDFGTEIRVTIQDCSENAIDISTATAQHIIFKKPDGTNLIKNTSFVTDGSDGVIKYITASGDINVVGAWKIQAHVILPSGEWKSEFKTFKVHRNL